MCVRQDGCGGYCRPGEMWLGRAQKGASTAGVISSAEPCGSGPVALGEASDHGSAGDHGDLGESADGGASEGTNITRRGGRSVWTRPLGLVHSSVQSGRCRAVQR